MDAKIRELERRARAGDQSDIDALIHARLRAGDNEDQAHCYFHGHTRFEWWYGASVSQGMADRLGRSQLDWRICLRCRLMEQKEYFPRWASTTNGLTLSVSTDGCTSSSTVTVDGRLANVSIPCTSDGVEPTRTSRGSRYDHPTKKRAWQERARLSKRELKRRKRQRKT